MYQPESTYRIQFHREFTFTHLLDIIPYLHQLGIKTIYASPIFEAMPGSTHGYDGIDPNKINPEIGTLDQFRQIAAELRNRDMGWIQDFVPNHMAFSPFNPWLCDFLEKGKMSVYDTFFDKNPDEPLMAPFLGKPFATALEEGEITLSYRDGKIQLSYFDSSYPLNYTAYYDTLSHEAFAGLPFGNILSAIDVLSQLTEKDAFNHKWRETKDMLGGVIADEIIRKDFEQALLVINQEKIFLQRLAEQQFYRLCCWQETSNKINYRRFFTINGLICMNIQHEEVFEAYHILLLQLYKEELIQGIRIDHIDGLYDPAGYLKQLRSCVGDDCYIVVEKILEQEEQLPQDWPIQGTTGYDFLAITNQVLTGKDGAQQLEKVYAKIAPDQADLQQKKYDYKRLILERYMKGEWDNLVREFMKLPGLSFPTFIRIEDIQAIIAGILIYCPVYRFYPVSFPFDRISEEGFKNLADQVALQPGISQEAMSFFRDCLLLEPGKGNEIYNNKLLHFWRRCMQVSGPLMAKGVEDTLMYNYHGLISRNEVGDSSELVGINTDEFHAKMIARAETLPLSMNATATHDTKRGEDARARLQTMAQDPATWITTAMKLMEDRKDSAGNLSLNDRYFLLQAVYAALPFKEQPDFPLRLKEYIEKAAREAKAGSSWEMPDSDYEQRLYEYALSLVTAKNKYGKFLHHLLKTEQRATFINSLVQLCLKCTCPGIPDIYQGTECWDFSFVDPDNRRAVDYDFRRSLLEKVSGNDVNARMLKDIADDQVKLLVLHRLLHLRKDYPDIFTKGSYEPLAGTNHIAFIRRYKGDAILVILPSKHADGNPRDVALNLDGERWRSIFTGVELNADEQGIAQALNDFPILVCRSLRPKSDRSAGVLMPLFSLPSKFGIGGMGKEAFDFLSFLARGHQKVWQLLPLNPLSEETIFSPYAATSAFAGEPMFIDPESLAEDALLSTDVLDGCRIDPVGTLDYKQVWSRKSVVLKLAWAAFKNGHSAISRESFDDFRIGAADWLDDYVLFAALKRKFNQQPWYRWPEPYRDRETETLHRFAAEEKELLDYEKWLQFIFDRQWRRLKKFAARRNITLLGDLPFYMSNDSADVWANRAYFQVSDDGAMKYVAGVPPDYFSETGQLWGMPTYNWQVMQAKGYEWWLKRLRRNTELYDMVRLDHFRAFYDYWEVPGSASTAVKGAWKDGPQDALFSRIQEHFPLMPFIAEDLGEMHPAVFSFCNKYKLRGMRVLQFGFDNYEGSLRDLPHNYRVYSVAYTGTHDNNTTKGWYSELSSNARQDLSAYAGYKVTEANVSATLLRLVYGSVSDMAIVPLQDILSLGSESRINTPSTAAKNWQWRLLPGLLNNDIAQELKILVHRYNR